MLLESAWKPLKITIFVKFSQRPLNWNYDPGCKAVNKCRQHFPTIFLLISRLSGACRNFLINTQPEAIVDKHFDMTLQQIWIYIIPFAGGILWWNHFFWIFNRGRNAHHENDILCVLTFWIHILKHSHFLLLLQVSMVMYKFNLSHNSDIMKQLVLGLTFWPKKANTKNLFGKHLPKWPRIPFPF